MSFVTPIIASQRHKFLQDIFVCCILSLITKWSTDISFQGNALFVP